MRYAVPTHKLAWETPAFPGQKKGASRRLFQREYFTFIRIIFPMYARYIRLTGRRLDPV